MDILNIEICRLCMGVEPTMHIFTDNLSLINKIQTCCNIQLYKNDGLPNHICTACADILEMIDNFQFKCKENNIILHQKLDETQIKTKSPKANVEYSKIKLELEDEMSISNENSTINSISTNISEKNKPNILKHTIKKKKKISKRKVLLTKTHAKIKIGENNSITGKSKANDIDIVLGTFKSNIDNTNCSLKTEKKVENFSNLCPFCGMVSLKSVPFRKHLKTHFDKPYICTVCSKSFTERGKLLTHKESHGEKVYPCELCGKLFKTFYDSHRHLEIVHKRSRSVECQVCGKQLVTRFGLKMHMKTHTGEKKYECHICKKKLGYRSTLQVHMRTHTGERPYVCRYCEATFTAIETLKQHERLHTGETPYCCSMCDKEFSQLSNLKSHFKNNHKGINFSYKYSKLKKQDLKNII